MDGDGWLWTVMKSDGWLMSRRSRMCQYSSATMPEVTITVTETEKKINSKVLDIRYCEAKISRKSLKRIPKK